jgi:hypothetical protein
MFGNSDPDSIHAVWNKHILVAPEYRQKASATVRIIVRNEVSSRLCLRVEIVGVNVLDVQCVVASDLKPFARVPSLLIRPRQ